MSANISRPSGRATHQLRDVEIIRNYTKHAEGSVSLSLAIHMCSARQALRKKSQAF
jgi:ribonuclease PH